LVVVVVVLVVVLVLVFSSIVGELQTDRSI
jgi:hypothetical protein